MDEKKRFSELAMRAAYTGNPQFTRFLEPSMERDAVSAAHAAGAKVTFFGGYENAERRMAALTAGQAPDNFPITTPELRWNAKSADARHRHLLGTVTGLGLYLDATGYV